jgi:hypothetical protein
MIMVGKATGETANQAALGPAQLLQFGKDRTDAMISVQKELLEAYQEASKAWASRVQSEVEFWSELAGKLAATRSVPEGVGTCSDSIAHRLEMAAEDGRRMFEEGQKVIAAVTRSLSGGLSKPT